LWPDLRDRLYFFQNIPGSKRAVIILQLFVDTFSNELGMDIHLKKSRIIDLISNQKMETFLMAGGSLREAGNNVTASYKYPSAIRNVLIWL